MQTYGQWLDFLARTEALDEAEGPGERVTPARVAAWRREGKLRGLAPTSRRQRLANLGAILRLLVPDRNWSFVIRPGNRSLKRAIGVGRSLSSCAMSLRCWSMSKSFIAKGSRLQTGRRDGVRYAMRPCWRCG
ncbi:hypothetical protein ACFQY5_40745 [Paeniroseomonas aquatica]|uniref:hypothetical protein n=1 Tax=Paeniroseomonas aquatica TaxID=373043 RepID=UPI0036219BFD